MHLAEADRGRGTVERFARLDAAQLTAVAFHEPKQLAEIQREMIREAEDVDEDAEGEAAKNRSLKMIAAVAKFDFSADGQETNPSESVASAMTGVPA